MHRRQGVLWLLTLIVVTAIGYVGWSLFAPTPRSGFPIVRLANAHVAVVLAEDSVLLPSQLRPGDRIDLSALAPATRIALIKSTNLNRLPNDSAYDLVVRHAGAEGAPTVITVHGVSLNQKSPVQRLLDWGLLTFFSYPFCLSAIALLSLWRGRGRDAMGLALWATAFLLGLTLQWIPSDGAIGLTVLLASNVLFLLARLSFYVMAEVMAATLLTPRAARGWRIAFFVMLGLGAIQSLAGLLAFVAMGWAELMRPAYGVVLTLSYAIPVAMLFSVLPRASSAQRLRLGWVTRCGAIYVAAIFLINSPIFGPVASPLIARGMFSLSLMGLLYGVVRTRLLDFSVVLNRTLVYAATTSLILGLFALFESVIERIAVGERASLLLELLVPLALGVSLTTVHRRIDGLVERLIFRRQYLQESTLRRFAHEAAFVSNPDSLMELTVTELQRHIGAPWVAHYESSRQGFALARQSGEHALPECVDVDDPAVIAVRAREPEVDLQNRGGVLRDEGYAFPLQVRGQLLGLLVIGLRPDEHYSSEERELFAHVAHEVSSALFALHAQASEAMLDEVRAMARASEERARASEALLLQLLPAAGTTLKT
ncbi:GAF domain-containing protein [Rhodanobacter sp. BL-MT-08]